MIRLENGKVEMKGTKTDLCAEFMTIVRATKDSGIFDSKDALLDSINFAIMDSDEQSDAMMRKMDEIIEEVVKRIKEEKTEVGDE